MQGSERSTARYPDVPLTLNSFGTSTVRIRHTCRSASCSWATGHKLVITLSHLHLLLWLSLWLSLSLSPSTSRSLHLLLWRQSKLHELHLPRHSSSRIGVQRQRLQRYGFRRPTVGRKEAKVAHVLIYGSRRTGAFIAVLHTLRTLGRTAHHLSKSTCPGGHCRG